MAQDSKTGAIPPAERLRTDDARVLAHMREALRGMQFGKLTVVVQDGIIVQIERTDKVRLRSGERAD